MKPDRLTTLLTVLQPATLARMVVDLQDLQQDWQQYPDEAPSEADRQALEHTLTAIMNHGITRSGSGSSDFRQLVEQVKVDHQEEDWSWERDQQEQENWLNDFD